MPIVTVNTNVSSKTIPDVFHEELTDIMYQALQKPKAVLYVDLKADANLTMGGDRNPCVYASVECIGRLNPSSNLSMARTMEDFFIKHLGVRRDRIVIIFVPVPALFCTYNGALHDVAIEKDGDLVKS